MSIRIISLFILSCCSVIHAKLEPETPAVPAESTVQSAPLTLAERQYVIECLARSIESLASHLDAAPPAEGEELIVSLERELDKNDVPTAQLSEAQRAFLAAERLMMTEALAQIKKAKPGERQALFQSLQEALVELRKDAAHEVQRICGTSHQFQDVVRELQIDARLKLIMGDGAEDAPDAVLRTQQMIEQLRAYAQELRALKTS